VPLEKFGEIPGFPCFCKGKGIVELIRARQTGSTRAPTELNQDSDGMQADPEAFDLFGYASRR